MAAKPRWNQGFSDCARARVSKGTGEIIHKFPTKPMDRFRKAKLFVRRIGKKSGTVGSGVNHLHESDGNPDPADAFHRNASIDRCSGSLIRFGWKPGRFLANPANLDRRVTIFAQRRIRPNLEFKPDLDVTANVPRQAPTVPSACATRT